VIQTTSQTGLMEREGCRRRIERRMERGEARRTNTV
jgi:hypothetical protein